MLQPTRLISTPFAQEGEKTEIQNVTGEFDNSATYRLGFPPLTMQSIRLGGKPPKGTDFNGVLFDITENISFLCKGGRYQYNAGLSTLIGGYPEGSNLLLDDNITEVVSTVAGNQNNPNTDMTGWTFKPNRTTAEYVLDASGETQQQVNYNGGSKWHSRVGGYLENERVVLANGDIVKSTVDGNTNDPNVDMTGWIPDFDTSAIQAEISTINTELSLKADTNYVDSQLTLKADTTYVDAAVGAISTDASKQYATLALANADIVNINLNQNVFISEAVNGGYWYKATAGATSLTKSAYDPLTQAKADATTKANAAEANAKAYTDTQAPIIADNKALSATAMLYKTSSSNLHEYADSEGGIVAAITSAGEFEAQDFKTESGNLSTVTKAVSQQEIAGYTHAFVDSDGNIVFGIKQDGSIVGGSSGGSGLAEMRAGLLNSIEMNEVGSKLDAKYFEDAPLLIDAVIALNTDDGAVGSRMPLIIKTGKNELCCIYHRMGVTTTDQSNVELVQRFITYDLAAKTISVSAMTSIIGDAINSPLVYHGQNCIKLKNGDFLLTYAHNKVHYKKISTDNCRTWSEPVAFITLAGNSSTIINGVADGLVRIKDGEYNGRLVLALWGTTPDGNIGGEVGCYYSDDEGVTWTLGGSIFDADFNDAGLISINEVAVACDAQNNLIFAIRNEGYSKNKPFNKVVFAISRDGGLTLEPYGSPRFSMSAVQPAFLQMSPTTYDGVPKMLMSHATAGGFNRTKFKLRLSYDNFNSIYAEYSPFAENINVGYSSLEKLDNSTIALAYEDGLTSERNIKIKFLNLAEII